MERENIITSSSKLTIDYRKSIIITGVVKINSFSPLEFIMDTTLGTLYLKGNDLEIVKLDTYQGNVAIKGLINSITYKDDLKKHEESIFSKLFK